MPSEKREWDGTEIEVSLTATFRYKVVAESYGDAQTLEQAVAIDMYNIQNDPVGVMSMELSNTDVDFMASWRKV